MKPALYLVLGRSKGLGLGLVHPWSVRIRLTGFKTVISQKLVIRFHRSQFLEKNHDEYHHSYTFNISFEKDSSEL